MRQLLTANIPDPLSVDSRGTTQYTQKFTGTGLSGQVNYLEAIPFSGGQFDVYVNGTKRALGTDYTLDTTNNLITWTGYNPPVSTLTTAQGVAISDNIVVIYVGVKLWVYDDHPHLNTGYFPRITVDEVESENQTTGLMDYQNYTASPGDKLTLPYKIIVKNREGDQEYLYQGVYYKNMDIVNAIGSNIERYLQTHKWKNCPWRFYDWTVKSSVRNRNEEDNGIFRRDITLSIEIFDVIGQ
jgi:hypothetical protein